MCVWETKMLFLPVCFLTISWCGRVIFPRGLRQSGGEKVFFSAQSEEETEGRVMYISGNFGLVAAFWTLKEKLRGKDSCKSDLQFPTFFISEFFFFFLHQDTTLPTPRTRVRTWLWTWRSWGGSWRRWRRSRSRRTRR